MSLSWQNDFAWRFIPIKGQENRFWFVIHGGDERRYCGDNKRVTLIEDDGVPTTVFVCKSKNKAAVEANFRPQIIYQFLHSALPDHAIRRYFPSVIPAMIARIEDNREFHEMRKWKHRMSYGRAKAKNPNRK